jgi:hypothetical protein
VGSGLGVVPVTPSPRPSPGGRREQDAASARVARLPIASAVTALLSGRFGAQTPWYRWRCLRGGGTRSARRSRNSPGERSTTPFSPGSRNRHALRQRQDPRRARLVPARQQPRHGDGRHRVHARPRELGHERVRDHEPALPG